MDDGDSKRSTSRSAWVALAAATAAVICAGTVCWAWYVQPVYRFELVYPVLRMPLSVLSVLLGATVIGWWIARRGRTLPALLALVLAVGAIGMSVRPLLEQAPQQRLYVLDVATGDPSAEIESLGTPFASTDDLVFAPDDEFRLVALDSRSGARQWHSTATVAPTSRVAPSAVTEEHLHVIGVDALLSTVALDDGSVAWTRDDVVAVATRDAATVIAIDHDGTDLRLVALDAATGEEQWRTDGFPCAVARQAPSCPNLPYDVLAVSATGAFVSDIRTGQLAAFDPATGALRWQVTVPQGSSRPAAGEATVVLHQTDPGGQAHLVAYDTATGEEQWRQDLGTYSFGFAARAGVLYAIDSRTTAPIPQGTGIDVLALDATTGEEQWTTPIDGTESDPFYANAIAVGGDTVVVAGSQRVVALGSSDGTLRWDVELDIPGETRRFTEPGYLEQPLVSASSAFVPARPPSEPSFGN